MMNVELSHRSVPWITKDGSLDPAKFPIEGILQQTLERGREGFVSGVRMLQMMYNHGRQEAGVFLLGLCVASEDDWDRRMTLAEAMRDIKTEACARLLFAELRRVKASNTTRRYLDVVIKALAAMPSELVSEEFDVLARDTSFSYKTRRKFRAAAGGGASPLGWP